MQPSWLPIFVDHIWHETENRHPSAGNTVVANFRQRLLATSRVSQGSLMTPESRLKLNETVPSNQVSPGSSFSTKVFLLQSTQYPAINSAFGDHFSVVINKSFCILSAPPPHTDSFPSPSNPTFNAVPRKPQTGHFSTKTRSRFCVFSDL